MDNADKIVAELTKQGYARIQFFQDDELDTMRKWSSTIEMKKANIVKGESYRGDETYWLDANRTNDFYIMRRLREHQVLLNKYYMLKTYDVEAHIAHYPAGASYGRHLDAPKNDNKRVLSLVAYFNPGWVPQHGGELRLYTDDGIVDIPPFHGTGVIFLSEEIEHEVLKTNVDRWSLAAWFRK
jgi:SM-20-related protein